jgi:hypothetical protein
LLLFFVRIVSFRLFSFSIHPVRISRGYEKAAEIATQRLKEIGDTVSLPFLLSTRTCLLLLLSLLSLLSFPCCIPHEDALGKKQILLMPAAFALGAGDGLFQSGAVLELLVLVHVAVALSFLSFRLSLFPCSQE